MIIYKSKNVGHRRVVEGALINICNKVEGNKAFTQEDELTDKLICHSINLDFNHFIKAPDTVYASSLPAQVVDVADVTDTTGADAEDSRQQEQQQNDSYIRQLDTQPLLRRSQRLANRNEQAAIR